MGSTKRKSSRSSINHQIKESTKISSLKAKQYDDTSVKPRNTPAYSHQQVHSDSTHAQANDAHVLMKQNMMTHFFTPRNTQAYLQTSKQANMRTSEQANMRTCEQANMHKYW